MWTQPYETKGICPECGKTFTGKQGKVFCNGNCRNNFHNRNKKPSPYKEKYFDLLIEHTILKEYVKSCIKPKSK